MSTTISEHSLEEIPYRPVPRSLGQAIVMIAQQMNTDPTRVDPFFYDADVPGHHRGVGFAEASRLMAEYLSGFKSDYRQAVQTLVQNGTFDSAVLGRLRLASHAPIFLTGSLDQTEHGAEFTETEGLVVLKSMHNELAGVHELTHLLLPGVQSTMVNEGFGQAASEIIYASMAPQRKPHRWRYAQFYTSHERLFWEVSRVSGRHFREWTKVCAGTNTAASTDALLGDVVQIGGVRERLDKHLEELERAHTSPMMHRPYLNKLTPNEMRHLIAQGMADDMATVATASALCV